MKNKWTKASKPGYRMDTSNDISTAYLMRNNGYNVTIKNEASIALSRTQYFVRLKEMGID